MSTVDETDVAKCPKCGAPVRDWRPYGRCASCKEPFPAALDAQMEALSYGSGPGVAVPRSAQRGAGSPVLDRYRDAYRAGAALVVLGNAIKIVGAVLAGIIVLGSLSSGNSPFGGGAVVVGIFLAAIVGFFSGSAA